MERGAWWATVHGAAEELDTTEQLNNNKTQYSTQQGAGGGALHCVALSCIILHPQSHFE